MNVKKILINNPQIFIDDVRSVRDFLVYAKITGEFIRINKKELISAAEQRNISYYITDQIFVSKRNAMIIN